LSQAAAERLEMVKAGITKVKLEVLEANRTSSN
jgi:rare lipoprotein A (peptidoglycan hydrolase)